MTSPDTPLEISDGHEPPAFVFGLDLGQTSDYTALCLLRRESGPKGAPPRFTVTNIARAALRTSYVEIVEKVRELAGNPALRPRWVRVYPGDFGVPSAEPIRRLDRPTVVVDATGVGRPIVDMFMRGGIAADLRPVVITGGHEETSVQWDSSGARAFHVPKASLVGTVQAVLQEGRLRVARGLEYAELLRSELLDFKVRVSKAGNESYAAREGAHDDLVLSVAMALWYGSRRPATCVSLPGPFAHLMIPSWMRDE